MGRLEEVEARQGATLEAVKAVDKTVEALFDEIRLLQGNGDISEAAAARLLAKEDEIDAAIAKVGTDEPEETPPS